MNGRMRPIHLHSMLGKLPHGGTWWGSGCCWPPALESQRQLHAPFKTLVVLVWQFPLSRLLKVPEACTLMCAWGPVYCQHLARVGPDKNTNFTDTPNYGHMGFSEFVLLWFSVSLSLYLSISLSLVLSLSLSFLFLVKRESSGSLFFGRLSAGRLVPSFHVVFMSLFRGRNTT